MIRIYRSPDTDRDLDLAPIDSIGIDQLLTQLFQQPCQLIGIGELQQQGKIILLKPSQGIGFTQIVE